MTVEQEMLIRGVLVLAHARFEQRRAAHAGKSEFHILPGFRQAVGGRQALAYGRIECRTADIGGHFEATPLVSRNAVEQRAAVIDPGRYAGFKITRIARGSAEEKNFLAGGVNQVAKQAGEHLAQPGTAAEHISVGRKLGTVG